jgi:hypothetical protein
MALGRVSLRPSLKTSRPTIYQKYLLVAGFAAPAGLICSSHDPCFLIIKTTKAIVTKVGTNRTLIVPAASKSPYLRDKAQNKIQKNRFGTRH